MMASGTIKKGMVNGALLLGSLLVIVLIDRILLSTIGLPLWESDPVLIYKHRLGIAYNWGDKFDNKPVYINQHGFHDDEFPEQKATGELRGLMIGDSIVMGHGVAAAETFANQLEHVLPDSVPGYARYQVINTGVQGYATYQYLEVLKQSLRFDPDFVAVGFCMNDVTEPYIVNKEYGGSGLDYHGLLQVSQPWVDYLVNETGFGRLAIDLRLRLKRAWRSPEERARGEIYSVRKMAQRDRTDDVFGESWDRVLHDLEAIYTVADQAEIPLVLLIFPHQFQVGDTAFQEPQRILKQHAAKHGISYLDITEVAEQHVAKGVSKKDLYLDRDHYTVQGHRMVSNALLQHLKANGIL